MRNSAKQRHGTFDKIVLTSNKILTSLLHWHWPLADQVQKISLVYLSGALRWAHRVPKRTCSVSHVTMESRGPCTTRKYIDWNVKDLQHVTKHVHSFEYSEPKLRDAFGLFLWFGFFFLCVLDGSLLLQILLKQQQNTTHHKRMTSVS